MTKTFCFLALSVFSSLSFAHSEELEICAQEAQKSAEAEAENRFESNQVMKSESIVWDYLDMNSDHVFEVLIQTQIPSSCRMLVYTKPSAHHMECQTLRVVALEGCPRSRVQSPDLF